MPCRHARISILPDSPIIVPACNHRHTAPCLLVQSEGMLLVPQVADLFPALKLTGKPL